MGNTQEFACASYKGLAGKVVVNTGGASGIGRAMADGFARHGAQLVLVDIDGAGLEKARIELTDAFPDSVIRTRVVSTTDDVAIDQMFSGIEEEFGSVDILLNNAGVSMNGPTLELSPADWRRVVDINLSGVFYCAQAAARRMLKHRGGVILNTASMWGVASAPNRAAYCATKAAVVSLTKVLAVEWAEYGIRVNAVCPGYTLTPLVQRLIESARIDSDMLCERTPMKRLGTAEEMAEVALFLASDSSVFITGHALVADGGWTADGF